MMIELLKILWAVLSDLLETEGEVGVEYAAGSLGMRDS